MKKIILAMMLLGVSLFAEVNNQYLTKDFLKKNIPIIDIRTPGEWRETGILHGAIPIMFFDKKGNYDAKKFLAQLNKKVNTKKPFALICHTGSRTSMVSPWLSKEFGYHVINLQGGMEYAVHTLHLQTQPYK
jgi:rhodanese-related sulfurtransferase